MVSVQTYRIKGFYHVQKNKFKFPFEKEVRAVTAKSAVEKVKQFIACRNVNPNRITIEAISRIEDTNAINNRVVKAFAEENMKI